MALAGSLAEVLRPGDVVLLAGDLGAGKTTFTKGLARAFGVEEHVTSPTFTLVRVYRTSESDVSGARGGTIRKLVHADLFRLGNLSEVVDLAIAEMLEDDEDGAVAVVEWGDVAVPVLGPDVLVVNLLQGAEPDERNVHLELSPSWESRRAELEDRLSTWRHAR